MGQVRALPANAATARVSATMPPDVQSTVFDHKGEILFQSAAAQRDFAAPRDTKRAACAFVRHFADRTEGRDLFQRAAAGQPSRGEKLVHTSGGVARRLVEISSLSGPEGEAGIMLNERPVDPAGAVDRDAEAIRVFAQAGADWFWETDAELRITLVSDRPNLAATSLTADLVGHVIYEPLPGIDSFDYAALRRTIERRDFIRDFRFTMRDRDGRRRHYSVSGAPFFAADGTCLGYCGTGRDRTRSVEAEEQAATAQARLIAAIESMPEAFVLFDRDRRLVMCNSRFREENAALAECLHPGATAIEIAAAARRAGRTAPAVDYVVEGLHNGRGHISVERQAGDRWFQLGARRVPEGGIAVVQTDVTALKRREAELAEKSALLQATLDNMHQGILVNDADARVVMWNHRFLEMNGLTAEMIRVGMPARDLVRIAAELGEYGGGAIDTLDTVVTRRLEQLGHRGVATMRVRPDGAVIENHANPMPDGMVIRTFTDVTQIRQQERESEDQRRLLSATLSNMDQGMLVLDADMRIRLWNRRLFDLMEVPESLCRVGMTLAQLISAMREAQGFAAENSGSAATERLRDASHPNTIGLAPENFGGRSIERRRRPLPDGGMVLTYTDVTEAKLREREVAEKSALLAATLEGMDQGIMVVGADSTVRMWNERLVEQYGFPRDFLHVGMPVDEVVRQLARQGEFGDGDPVELAKSRIAAVDGDPGRVFARRLKSGRVIERRWRDMPSGGSVLTHTDITALTERERAFEEKSAHLSAVLGTMDQGVLVLDKDAKIRTWNSRVVELLNLPSDRLQVGMPATELTRWLSIRMGQAPAEIEQSIAQRLHEVLAGEPRMLGGPSLDNRVVERRSLRMPDGGVVVTYSDVTERKRREDLLAENSALLGATLDNMDQGLVVIDADHRTKLWNNRLIEMFNLPSDLMRRGRPFVEVLRYFIESYGTPPDQVEARVAERMAELEGDATPVIDRHRPDGRVIERRRRVMPSGGSVITYGDVTIRKRGEAALQRAKEEAEIASRSKTEFLANMSHELRTPLNAIIGFSDILVRQLFGPLGTPRYAEYAKDIHDSGQHLLNLINDVLDISKIEVNKIELAEETIDVPAAIESCLRFMRDRATAAGVVIAVEMPETLPVLRGDDRRLKQVLLNLVSNAVKFTPAGGRVEIRVEADATGFRFVVADNGIGIAKSDLETALRPFGQIDSSLARRYQGTGLGLPLARSMAELHGGKLNIESEPGVGTTVTVWLPPTRTAH